MVGLNFFPAKEPAALKELSNALLRAAGSPEQAARIVSAWIETNTDRPTPADFIRIAHEMNESVALPAPCENCAPLNGYVLVERIVKSGMFVGERRSAVDPCACPLGRALAAKAAELAEESAAMQSPTSRTMQKVTLPNGIAGGADLRVGRNQ